MSTKKIYDIAILGAGAAGLMAAIAAESCKALVPGLAIAILEKNEKAGKKLYATGNGRCNLLNRTSNPEDMRSAEGDAAGFTAASLAQCGPEELLRIFEDLGLDTVEEDGGRLYPRSLQAASVVHALERGALGGAEYEECRGAAGKAQLLCGFEAKTAELVPGAAAGNAKAQATVIAPDAAAGSTKAQLAVTAPDVPQELFAVHAADGRTVLARRLILASGGKAGIQYGCDGRGLKIAESLGHRIVRPIPALTGLVCEETELLEEVAGVRARGRVSLWACSPNGSRSVLSESAGEIQFNKDSVSGICVMDVSGAFRRRDGECFVLELDLMPEWEEAALAEKLAARRDALGDYFLDALLPTKLAEAMVRLAGGTDAEPQALAKLLKTLRFTPTASKGWKEAHTTSGGIALEEVDPKTLESRLIPGLYTAGEALDIDGPCGGYNLTWAFSSGWTAGRAAAMSLAGSSEEKR